MDIEAPLASVLKCFPPPPPDDRAKLATSTVAIYDAESARNPGNPKLWLLYLRAEAAAHPIRRFQIFERAVRANPRSYKLWKLYLEERADFMWPSQGGGGKSAFRPGDAAWPATNCCFERALTFLSTMPKLWEMYLRFLMLQKWEITLTRRTFDRALQSIAITQHDRIWKPFVIFAETHRELAGTSIPILRRCSMLEPARFWNLCDLLEEHGLYDAAASRLAAALASNSAPVGQSRHTIWRRLCSLVAAHPVRALDTSAILQAALARVAAGSGSLWASLAMHRLRIHRQAARDVFEAALQSVATTADFAVVFDAYVGFYQQMLKDEAGANDPSIELEICRLRTLLSRRRELRSDAALRQNPHNVAEWLARAQIFLEDPAKVIAVLTQAVVSVDPFRAVGKPLALWLRLAAVYDAHGDRANGDKVFERALGAKFKSADDLISLWCRAVERELLAERWTEALELARRSIHRPGIAQLRGDKEAGAGPVSLEGHWQRSMCKSVRLWALLLDLERCFGTDATLASAFSRLCDSKTVTPRLLLSHAAELERRKRWAESFRCYERGVALFRFPHAYRIWVPYLAKFVARFRGTQLERARELFDQALTDCPAHLVRRLVLMYANVEELYGVPRRALAVLADGVKKVESAKDKLDFYRLLAAKTAEYMGVTKTRVIWSEAISELATEPPLCVAAAMELARIERGLGEIARARAVYKHASQFAATDENFWKFWREFEVQHGNEESFKDWLLTKKLLTSRPKDAPLACQ